MVVPAKDVRVLIFGASGMVGMGALLEALDDPRVRSVLVVGRSACGVRHAKLMEVLHTDFFNYDPLMKEFVSCDACFFCLGVSAAGLSEEKYDHLTFDLTLAAAKALAAANAGMTFCYVSGEGTDSTERGRVRWARVKGKTENALLRLPFKAAYMLRPGFIQPMRGVRSKTRLYQTLITIFRPIFPLIRRLLPQQTTTSVNVGRALLHLAVQGDSQRILRSADINRLAAAAVAVALAVSLGSSAHAQARPPAAASAQQERVVTTMARGTFEVKLNPLAAYNTDEGSLIGRMSVDKEYQGDLKATSKGEMVASRTAVANSAGYVAIERVSGTLNGRKGTFVLQHSSTMTRGTATQNVTVVPDSGTDQLVGLAGSMLIIIEGGKHSYEFTYTIAGSP